MLGFIYSSKTQSALLVILVIFCPLAIDIYLPALPIIASTFQVDSVLAQGTITWFLFAMGVGQLFVGPLADKFGRRTVALCGVTIYLVSSLLAWSAQNIEWMLMSRLLQGLGASATSVAAFAVVSGVLVFFMMKETSPKTGKQAVFLVSRYWSVLSTPSFVFHALLCLMTMAVLLAYVTSAPLVLMTGMGLSMDEFTFWFGINATINIVGCMLAPKLMNRLGTRNTLVAGLFILVLAGVLIMAMNGRNTALSFMAPIFISSIGFTMILGGAAGKALAPFGDKAGTAAALLGLFQMSGSGLLVGAIQRLPFEPQILLAIHMWILFPALFFLCASSINKRLKL
ncbi:TPA: MFS transporter [Vibrio parahaemolyticus]|uniref:Putative multidrug resistance protein n=1 Tax=Vibrio parahaemolyticus TaxID=670 RepID=B9A7W3_VIBPH|nr:putative multidrug resistance protein [Vibrio parahaemolyticus]